MPTVFRAAAVPLPDEATLRLADAPSTPLDVDADVCVFAEGAAELACEPDTPPCVEAGVDVDVDVLLPAAEAGAVEVPAVVSPLVLADEPVVAPAPDVVEPEVDSLSPDSDWFEPKVDSFSFSPDSDSFEPEVDSCSLLLNPVELLVDSLSPLWQVGESVVDSC